VSNDSEARLRVLGCVVFYVSVEAGIAQPVTHGVIDPLKMFNVETV
jgi:hypothetical protein